MPQIRGGKGDKKECPKVNRIRIRVREGGIQGGLDY